MPQDTQTPMKPANFGKAIGIDKPANVRDKIRKWQADLEADHSGAENAVPTTASPKLQPTPKAAPLEEKSGPRPVSTPKKPSQALPHTTPKSAKKPTHNQLDEDLLSATAPKKRVVSDSHWRTQKSPTKDGKDKDGKEAALRKSPKPVPTAWVRPAARKAGNPETKVSTPHKLELKPPIEFGPKSTEQRPKPRNPRRRRPSQPTSGDNEKRPVTSGSGSSSADNGGHGVPTSPKSPGDKYDLIRVRRRRRSGNSRRSSLSADNATSQDGTGPANLRTTEDQGGVNQITVEYEESRVEPVKNDFKRTRRRSARRSRDHISPEGSPRQPLPSGRRRSPHKPSKSDTEAGGTPLVRDSPDPQTPPNPLGNRLEAWLQTTPDPFADADSSKRRKSRDPVTLSDPPQKADKTELSASSASHNVSADDVPRNGSSSRRKSGVRRRSPQSRGREKEPQPSSTVSSEITEDSSFSKSDLTSTPTLKRRGARRSQQSPTKERIKSPPPPSKDIADDASSLLSCVPSSVPTTVTSSSVITPPPQPDVVPPPFMPDNFATRRIFPTTGKRLSTIVSVETFTTKLQNAAPSVAVGSEAVEPQRNSVKRTDEPIASEAGSVLSTETSTTLRRRSTRRNKLARHADLMSVLSMPVAGTKSIVSARSIRTNRSRLATATIDDIMNELASDEAKYMRELRTLVDGVIPVLLSCVLSKSESAIAAGLFSRTSKVDPSDVTKPIVDMGVSLERLKSLHRRVPKDNSDALLSWARSAQRIYSDYINVWRVGFEDVVVNLAPADEDPFTPAKVVHGPTDAAPWDEGLPRNAEGYVVNGDGERVDVAYMLKRPLVRLKYLAKTFRGINHVKPSEQAEHTSNAFQELVTAARKRANDERARLEDEAAASIDPTRARDPRSLAPLAGVRINPTRCVRARDYFDMHLMHSTGQEISCQVEVLLRDNPAGSAAGGDVLICEVDAKGRWLLLPPIQHGLISARSGDQPGELVIMMRGYQSDGKEWSEIFTLRIQDEQAGIEWVHMFGTQPVPPEIQQVKQERRILEHPSEPTFSQTESSIVSADTGSTPPHKSRSPSPHEIEVPIGEQANATSKRWSYDTPDRTAAASPITAPSTVVSATRELSETDIEVRVAAAKGRAPLVNVRPSRDSVVSEDESLARTPRSLNEAMKMAGRGSPGMLKRTKAKRRSKVMSPPPESPATPPRASRHIVVSDPEDEIQPPRKFSKRRSQPPESTTSSALSEPRKPFSVWLPSSDVEYSSGSESDSEDDVRTDSQRPERPGAHRRVSSVPSMEFPTISRVRKTSQPTTPVKEPVKAHNHDQEALTAPASAPSKMQRSAARERKEQLSTTHDDARPPPVPPHRTPSPASPATLKASTTPILTPALPGFKNKRRSSSPLKHEYAPSTATESPSETDQSETETEESSEFSESSDGELEDDISVPPLPAAQTPLPPKVSPPASIYTLPNGTITPSQSASNTPYRTVPQGSGEASKAIASIFTWSDAGHWDPLHPEECSIVVTPGKVQVFEISEAHSKSFLADGDEIIQPERGQPLIAVELTPLVPMRKSTAIDITIRSPPTAESRIRSGTNIMLRSRNPAECAQLYAMINQSRINNPTYLALQNARGPYGQSSWAEAMDRQNAARTNGGSSGGWFSGSLGRKSSYRKTSTRAASISAVTESSVGTMNSALRSALSRFTFGKNGRFNIRGSTLGSRSITSFDTGSGSSGSGSNTPPSTDSNAPRAPAGITTVKCRLYERDSFSSKWRDMGHARLSIMLPDMSMVQPTPRQGKGSPGMRNPTQEKRILVEGKSAGETLLDVTLGESSFERVARTGIAVSVWEDVVGPDGQVGTAAAVGGVSGARATVYMIQVSVAMRERFNSQLIRYR
ncbi:hypothetical protein M011DRAFT_398968 [Sporormia fimetaria CBS 119925]|uniref:Uncharacterized protein n=1 Tax=Sporormia fimetaria CBS 119925 TaxID=1340428 RepID=A0A6A6VI67_9PLEO|nr:hypothetical protein M011DRAFT_398968 [Sporormia fimetaria CBS 119925]